MTDHEPRLLDSADAVTRSLLESALRDRAPATGPARTAALLGLGELTAAAPAFSRAAAVAPGVAAGKATVGAGTAGVFAGTGKWLAIGLVAGSVASIGSFTLQQQTGPAATPSAAAPSLPNPSPLPPAERAPSMAPATAPNEVVKEPTTAARSRERAATTPSARLTAPLLDASSGAMARETAWIDQARAALRRGDTNTARNALATYAAQRSVGVLDREALLLGVELAVKEGDRARALRLATGFEAKYPNDAHLPRLRELVAKSGP